MNAVVEPLPNCLATLRVEVDPEKVIQVREELVRDFGKNVRVPGFRQGKVPRAMVERRFAKQIREELEGRLLRETSREAIRDKKLRVLQISNVEDVQFGEDNKLSYTATLVTHPDFELPVYKGLGVQLGTAEVTDAEIGESIDSLREQASDFTDVPERAAEMGDYVVVDYAGAIDGQPVHEVFPKAGKPLTANDDFWIKMTDEAFFPGFCSALVGLKPGEGKEFDVEVPADFPVEGMPGKQIHYRVTLKAIKARQLPELDDAFAGTVIKGKTLAELREIAREELTRQKQAGLEADKRRQIMRQLLASVECELPAVLLRSETQRMVNEIVTENRSRGVTDEVIKGSEKELVGAAAQNAREKVKGTFILTRIAEAEGLKVESGEIYGRVAAMAERYQMTFEKMFKELDKRNALDEIRQELLSTKALDFLAVNASVSEALQAPAENPAA